MDQYSCLRQLFCTHSFYLPRIHKSMKCLEDHTLLLDHKLGNREDDLPGGIPWHHYTPLKINLFVINDLPSCNSSSFRLCEYLQFGSHLSRTSSEWLWNTFALDKAHSAITSNWKSFMVTEPWNFYSSLSACLVNGIWTIDLNGFAIDIDIKSLREALRWSED